MKRFIKHYRHLSGLLAVIGLAVFSVVTNIFSAGTAFALVSCYQLMCFATTKAHGPLYITAGLTPEQVKEFEHMLKGFEEYGGMLKELGLIAKEEGGFAIIRKLPEVLKGEQKRIDDLHEQVKSLSKLMLKQTRTGVEWRNGIAYVTDECAKFIGSMAVIRAKQSNKLAGEGAELLFQRACEFAGIEQKTALTSTDVPLPTQFAAQIVELVYTYGQARKLCTVYPLGTATVKLPRLKTGESTFGFITMSGSVTEKNVQVEFVTFTPGKCGGIVRVPSEIDADSIVAVGQFIARYIAREMGKAEDTCLFLGDGTATYNSIQGIGAQATTDANKLTLATSNTSSDKITLANCRGIRALVSGAVLKTAKYYAHPSFDALFVSYNTSATVVPYQRLPDGSATLDGFPIVWVSTMPVYSTSANVSSYQIYFGDLSWWYFGERLSLTVQTSNDVYFATDEIGIRALERIDIHCMGQQSSTALQLSAS